MYQLSNRARSNKLDNRKPTQLGLEELEARLMNAADGIQSNLQVLTSSQYFGSTQITANSSPTIATPIVLSGGSEVRGRTANLSVLGADDSGESSLRYTWQVSSQPAGANVFFTRNSNNSAKNNTLIFDRAGTYNVIVEIRDRQGLTTTNSIQFNVIQNLTGIVARTTDGKSISGLTLNVAGTSQRLNAQALDQFGNVMVSQPNITWQTISAPTGGAATLTVEGDSTVASFSRAGTYVLRAQSGNASSQVSLNVTPTLKALSFAHSDSTSIAAGSAIDVTSSSQRVLVFGVDQFGNALTKLPNIVLSATSTPAGGAFNGSVNNGVATLTFHRLGSYAIRASSNGESFIFTANVIPTLTSISARTPDYRVISPNSALTVAGTLQTLSAIGLDQFGGALAKQPSITWQVVTSPSGSSPVLTNSGNSTSIALDRAGSYRLRAQAGNQATNVNLNVIQTLTSIDLAKLDGTLIDPRESLVATGASHRVAVRGFDQFGNAIANMPNLTWSATSAPSGVSFTASVNAGVATLYFNRLGSYALRVQGGASSLNFSMTVVPTLTTIVARSTDHRPISTSAALSVAGTSQVVNAVGLDQFGNTLSQQPDIIWASTSTPAGGIATLSSLSNSLKVSLNRAGTYGFRATSGNVSMNLSLNVLQTLTSLMASVPNGSAVSADGAISLSGSSQQLTLRGFDQFGHAISSLPNLTWTPLSAPIGASVAVSVSSGIGTFRFNRAGLYSLRGQSGSALIHLSFQVSQTLTSFIAIDSTGRTVNSASVISVTSTTQKLRARGLDQFGQTMLYQPAVTWSTLTTPTGATLSTSISDNEGTFTFSRVGRYSVRAASGSTMLVLNFNVVATATNLVVTPGNLNLQYSANQLFRAQVLDQFQQALSSQPTISWTANGGTITSTGLFTAGTRAGSFTLTARAGTLTNTIQIEIYAPTPQTTLRNAAIAEQVKLYYSDGELSRQEVIQVLRSAGGDGVVDATELADFQFLVSSQSTFAMPTHVRELAKDVVGSNPANRMFRGQAAGNLSAGSSATLLNNLIDKWFLGADEPAIAGSGISYRVASGNLFNGTPSRNDARQGMLGDCYFIAALVSIADKNPYAVQNLFIDNGDNTYTVRFYAGALGGFYSNGLISSGFVSGSGTADYVTVSRKLPTYSSGLLAYSGYGQSATNPSTPLWIALAEKAYAQWNETGNAGRDGTNRYAAIEGGWMSNVNAQILGYNSTNYYFSTATKQALILAIDSGNAVTLGTLSGANAGGLVGGHAYTVTGYNAATDTFSLHNPWGFSHPTPLTWAQLKSNGSMFTVANPIGSTANITAAVLPNTREFPLDSWTEVVQVAPFTRDTHDQKNDSIERNPTEERSLVMSSTVQNAIEVLEQKLDKLPSLRNVETDAVELANLTAELIDLALMDLDFNHLLS